MDKLDLKAFVSKRILFKKAEKQPTKWEKICGNHLSDRDLVRRIYKLFLKLNNRNVNNPVLKWAKNWNSHFSKKRYTVGQKAHEPKCSASLVVGATQLRSAVWWPPHVRWDGHR